MTNFDKFTIAIGILSLCTLAAIVFHYNTRPDTVVLDAKHFKCTDTMPDGLGSRCTNYAYIGVK